MTQLQGCRRDSSRKGGGLATGAGGVQRARETPDPGVPVSSATRLSPVASAPVGSVHPQGRRLRPRNPRKDPGTHCHHHSWSFPSSAPAGAASLYLTGGRGVVVVIGEMRAVLSRCQGGGV